MLELEQRVVEHRLQIPHPLLGGFQQADQMDDGMRVSAFLQGGCRHLVVIPAQGGCRHLVVIPAQVRPGFVILDLLQCLGCLQQKRAAIAGPLMRVHQSDVIVKFRK